MRDRWQEVWPARAGRHYCPTAHMRNETASRSSTAARISFSRIAIAITGDHGVATIPELTATSLPKTPVRVDAATLASGLRSALARFKIDSTLVEMDAQTVLVNRAASGARTVAVDSALAMFVTQTRALPGIARVDRFQDLLRGDTINDPIARRWAHQFPPSSNVALVITLTPFSIFSGIVATHGSPYDYDTHVPVIFYGPWFVRRRYPEFVRTVDIAPTLAFVAGVKPTERLDGGVLTPALRVKRNPR